MIDISVIIPVYRESNYLGGLLDNLARQSWHFRTEIIICEYKPDGTSKKIIGAFRQVYPHQAIRLIEIAEKGIASARNEGIAVARGAIIVNLDADNVFADTKCIEKLCEPLIEGKAVMTHSRIRIDTSEARNEQELQKMRSLYVVDQLPFIITGVAFFKFLWEEIGGFQGKDPYEMAIFATQTYWRYPGQIKRVEDALVLTSARRTLKEKELGVLEHTFKRTSAVRQGKIIWGDDEDYDI